MRENNGRFLKGALSLTVSAIILKVIGLVYKVPLSYILGDEGMGYFNSAYTVYTFFYLISTSGIPKAVSITVARAEAEGGKASTRIYKVCLAFFTCFGALVSILFFTFSQQISAAVGNSGAAFSMYAIAPSILFVCAAGVARGYLGGSLRFLPIAISELISGVGKLFLGLALAFYASARGYSLPTIAAYTIFGITVGSLLSLLFLLVSTSHSPNRCEELKIGFWTTIKEILKISLPITLASAASGVASMLDLGLIMRGLGGEGYSEGVASALYGNYTTLALPMFTLVATVITPISTALMPTLTHALARGEISEGREKIRGALTFISFISAPCALFCLLFPSEILSVIFEEGSATVGAAMLSALAPSMLILGPLTLMNTSIEAEGRVVLPVVSLTLGSLAKLISCPLLIRLDSVGILAAPISTLVSYSVSFIITYFLFRRSAFGALGILPRLASPILISAAAAVVGYASVSPLSPHLTKKAYCTIFILILGASYLVFSLILSKKTRKTLCNFVKINKNRIKHL